MKHLKITQTGWEGFTGDLGFVEFKDGVSVEPLTDRQAAQISAAVLCVTVDEKGNEEGQHGIATDMIGGVTLSVDPVEELRRAKPGDLIAERRKAVVDSEKPPTKIYEREELEAIAEDKGINGLREIGSSWGARERSIAALIDAIMKAQKEWQASVQSKIEARRAREEQALKDSLMLEQKREDEIKAKARNLEAEAQLDADREAAEKENAEFDAKKAEEADFVEDEEEDDENEVK
jgi:hypothetical protein